MKLFVFPGNLPPEVLEAASQEVPYARTPSFGSLVRACHQRLAALAGAAQGEVLSFTASGTGALEALFGGWGPRWRRLLVLQAGTFGRRWYEMADHLGVAADELAWQAHDTPPWPAIESALASGRHDAVVAVHHETSTGELLDLARLGVLCRSAGAKLLVDAIGSFLADPFAMDEWGVDAAALSSQKGLCLPPGLSFLVIRPALGPPAERSLSYYFDPRRHSESFARGQPPWSPAAQIYVQLDRRLSAMDASGGAASVRAGVERKAHAFRAAVIARGWTAATRRASACLTALRFSAPAAALVTDLAGEGWFVLPSPDPCLVRVAHLGQTTVDDHLELAARLFSHAERLGLSAAGPPPPPTP